ncbi:hypothetical protein AB0L25_32795 [Spirillospora sp. NPDC052242]
MRTDMRPADALLAEIEPLAHAERRRRVAELRRLAGGRELVPLLVDLGQRGPYERGLALALAAAARDEASREHIAVVRAAAEADGARAHLDSLLDLVLTADLDVSRIDPRWTHRWTSRRQAFLALLARGASHT